MYTLYFEKEQKGVVVSFFPSVADVLLSQIPMIGVKHEIVIKHEYKSEASRPIPLARFPFISLDVPTSIHPSIHG